MSVCENMVAGGVFFFVQGILSLVHLSHDTVKTSPVEEEELDNQQDDYC
jgi:hypothetical protein